jgi:hypothetical protein
LKMHRQTTVGLRSEDRQRRCRGDRAEQGGRVALAPYRRLHVASACAGVKSESTPQPSSLALPPLHSIALCLRRAAPPQTSPRPCELTTAPQPTKPHPQLCLRLLDLLYLLLESISFSTRSSPEHRRRHGPLWPAHLHRSPPSLTPVPTSSTRVDACG